MADRLSVQFHNLQVEELDNSGRVIRGAVMATEGEFVDGRGAFDREGLQQIASMAGSFPKGLKSRFGHPSLLYDGLGRFLGRWRNPRMATGINPAGDKVPAVRGDLHIDESSFDTPYGDLGGYVLKLAATDSDAFSSSLVIVPIKKARNGAVPLWFPEELAASDIVEEGAAVGPLLGNAQAIRAELPQLLDSAFGGDREDMDRFWGEYLLAKFGTPPPTPLLDARRERMQAALRKVGNGSAR